MPQAWFQISLQFPLDYSHFHSYYFCIESYHKRKVFKGEFDDKHLSKQQQKRAWRFVYYSLRASVKKVCREILREGRIIIRQYFLPIGGSTSVNCKSWTNFVDYLQINIQIMKCSKIDLNYFI